MLVKSKISLQVPGSKDSNEYFSIRLKHNLTKEGVEYKMPPKILVVSDIEGNFIAFRELLLNNRVISKNYEWTFGDGHLIILGDCFDRGEQVIECLWLIYSLEERAHRVGGHLHFILGNHEIMNMNGDWRYVHPKYAEKKAGKLNAALYHGNTEIWNWLQTKNIIEKVGDIMFVHGGISPEFASLNVSIPEINNLARQYYRSANQIFFDCLLNIIFNSKNSPFWYRGYYQQAIKENEVDMLLSHFGVRAIITGHTVVNHVTSFFNRKIINVDTNQEGGISEGLLIKGDKFYRVDIKGNKQRI